LPKSGLRDLEFSAILRTEQFDVRRFLLADSPIAPVPERRDSSILYFRISIFAFGPKKDFPWLH